MKPKDINGNELRAHGLKATGSRIAIISEIAHIEGYFTPHKLYNLLKVKGTRIGLVTVYRSLSALKNAGLVCEIESTGNSHIYVRRSSAHHHHLVCRSCARVVEFGDCDLDSLARKLSSETGFLIQSHSLEFQGYCKTCAGLK